MQPKDMANDHQIGVVGAGNMGSGIAQKYATAGFFVVLVDLNEDALKKGRARIEATLSEAVARRIFTETTAREILSRITFAADLAALSHSKLIIEAIFEDKSVKKELFQALDKICLPSTILATNTSSFSVTELASATKRDDRFVGLHYFYHPAKNKLVEVVKGKNTSSDTFTRVWEIQEQMGKIPIESKDAPGFIVNRFFVPWLNEAMRMVEEGAANIATVEEAAKQTFGIGMGPFELMNVTGVPITLHAANTLAHELGAFYGPCALIRPVVANGTTWDLAGHIDTMKFAEISSRLLGVVFAVATQIVFGEKVCSLEDCDIGARVGLRWKKGPFELFSGIGIETGLEYIDQIAIKFPELVLPAELKAIARSRPIEPQFVISHIEGEVGHIILNRPDSLNALNEIVIQQLQREFSRLERHQEVRGIVIEGRGKAFVAGADTLFFVEQMRQNNIDRIVQFAAQAQDLFYQIDICEKPVVCCIDGFALGGGLELALACDYIIGTFNAKIGFPETGIGIYPGLGGTQRTPRRIGVPLARWMVLTGEIIDAKMALAMGFFDDVVSLDDLKRCAQKMALSKPARNNKVPPTQIPEGFDDLAQVFFSPLPDLLKQDAAKTNERVQKSIKKMTFKAPLALASADELISAADTLSLDKGLRAETSGLSRIFKTQDAMVGLSSIGKERPVFNGT